MSTIECVAISAICMVVAVIGMVVIGYTQYQKGYEHGRGEGRAEGYAEGYDDGRDSWLKL